MPKVSAPEFNRAKLRETRQLAGLTIPELQAALAKRGWLYSEGHLRAIETRKGAAQVLVARIAQVLNVPARSFYEPGTAAGPDPEGNGPA